MQGRLLVQRICSGPSVLSHFETPAINSRTKKNDRYVLRVRYRAVLGVLTMMWASNLVDGTLIAERGEVLIEIRFLVVKLVRITFIDRAVKFSTALSRSKLSGVIFDSYGCNLIGCNIVVLWGGVDPFAPFTHQMSEYVGIEKTMDKFIQLIKSWWKYWSQKLFPIGQR